MVICDFFLICFIEAPLSVFTRNQRFCEHRDLLRVFGTVRLSGNIFRKKFVNSFLNFSFFERFSVEQDGFFAVSIWGKVVFEFYAYPFWYFLYCKIDGILTIVSFLLSLAISHSASTVEEDMFT